MASESSATATTVSPHPSSQVATCNHAGACPPAIMQQRMLDRMGRTSEVIGDVRSERESSIAKWSDQRSLLPITMTSPKRFVKSDKKDFRLARSSNQSTVLLAFRFRFRFRFRLGKDPRILLGWIERKRFGASPKTSIVGIPCQSDKGLTRLSPWRSSRTFKPDKY